MSNFKKSYRIKQNAFDLSLKRELALKADPVYEKEADKAAMILISTFHPYYPGVEIEDPIIREKSEKSLLPKKKTLQIERFSKLMNIKELSESETKELLDLLFSRVQESISLEQQASIFKQIQDITCSDLSTLPIPQIEEVLMNSSLSNSTKTALLRILYARLKNSQLENKDELLSQIDKNYGKTAAQLSGKPEDDILGYASIESIKPNSHKLWRLQNEEEFLRCMDLRGMQIIIKSIPEHFTCDNPYINYAVKMRDSFPQNSAEWIHWDQTSMNLISSDFIDKLNYNRELEEKYHCKTVIDSRKHKNKSNGYVADHIKFELAGNRFYTLELQVKSHYVEEISKGNGSAAHEQRPGKQRILPDFTSLDTFQHSLDTILPKYKVFEASNNYKPYKFTPLENALKYYESTFKKDHTIAMKTIFYYKQLKKRLDKQKKEEQEIA